MVEQPAWLFLKEGRVGMNEHRLLLFHRAVAAASQPCCVVKVTSSDGLWSRWERKSVGKAGVHGPSALTAFLVQALGELER